VNLLGEFNKLLKFSKDFRLFNKSLRAEKNLLEASIFEVTDETPVLAAMVTSFMDIVISLFKISRKNDALKAVVDNFLENRFNLSFFVGCFPNLKCSSLKSGVLRFLTEVYFKNSGALKTLPLVKSDEQIIRNYTRFRQVDSCQEQFCKSDQYSESRTLTLYKLLGEINHEISQEMDQFQFLKLSHKKYVFQRLRFIRNLLVYGYITKIKLKELKHFLLKTVEILSRYDFKAVYRLFVKSSQIGDNIPKGTLANVKINLQILCLCLELLNIVQEYSLFYKKNFLLQTCIQNSKNIATFKRKTDRFFFGCEQFLEAAKFDTETEGPPENSKNEGSQNEMILNLQRSLTIQRKYTGRGEKAAINIRNEKIKPFKHRFLPLGYFLVLLEEELTAQISGEIDSSFADQFQAILTDLDSCLQNVLSIQVKHLHFSSDLLIFFKKLKTLRYLSGDLNLQSPRFQGSVEAFEKNSFSNLVQGLYSDNFIQLNDFLVSNLERLKEAYSTKILFKQSQALLKIGGFEKVIQFVSDFSRKGELPSELVDNYVLLLNFFAFMNRKNCEMLHTYIEHLFRFSESKYALNVALQIAHTTNDLSVLFLLAEHGVTKYSALDVKFLKSGGYTVDSGTESDRGSHNQIDKNLLGQMSSLLDMFSSLIGECNSQADKIADQIFRGLQTCLSVQQVTSLDLFADLDHFALQQSNLSETSIQLSVKVIKYVSKTISVSRNSLDLFKKHSSGKQLDILVNSPQKDPSLRCAFLQLYYEAYLKPHAQIQMKSVKAYLAKTILKPLANFAEEFKKTANVHRKDKSARKSVKSQSKKKFYFLVGQLYEQNFASADGILVFYYHCLTLLGEFLDSKWTSSEKLGAQGNEFIFSVENQRAFMEKAKSILTDIFEVFSSTSLTDQTFNDFWKFQLISYYHGCLKIISKCVLPEKQKDTGSIENILPSLEINDEKNNLLRRTNSQDEPEKTTKPKSWMAELSSKVLQFLKRSNLNAEFFFTELLLDDVLTFDEKIRFLYKKSFDGGPDCIEDASFLAELKKEYFFKKNNHIRNENHLFVEFTHHLLWLADGEITQETMVDLDRNVPNLSQNNLEVVEQIVQNPVDITVWRHVKNGLKFNKEKVKFLSIMQDEFTESTSAGANRFYEMFISAHRKMKIKSFLGNSEEQQTFFVSFLYKILKRVLNNLSRNPGANSELLSNKSILNDKVGKVICFYLAKSRSRKLTLKCLKTLFCLLELRNNFQENQWNLRSQPIDFTFSSDLSAALEKFIELSLAEITDQVHRRSDDRFELQDLSNTKKSASSKNFKMTQAVFKLIGNILGSGKDPKKMKENSDSLTLLSPQIIQQVCHFLFSFSICLNKNFSLLQNTMTDFDVVLGKIINSNYNLIAKMLSLDLLSDDQIRKITKITAHIFQKINSMNIAQFQSNTLKTHLIYIFSKLLRLILNHFDESECGLRNQLEASFVSNLIDFCQKIYSVFIFPKLIQIQNENFCGLAGDTDECPNTCTPSYCQEGKATKCDCWLKEIASTSFWIWKKLNQDSLVFDTGSLPGNAHANEPTVHSFIKFFQQSETTVEIFLKGRPIHYSFKTPKLASESSPEMISTFKKQLAGASNNADFEDIYNSMKKMIQKMQQMRAFVSKPFFKFFRKHERIIDMGIFLLILACNIFILFSMKKTETSINQSYFAFGLSWVFSSQKFIIAMYFLFAILLIVATLVKLAVSVFIDYIKAKHPIVEGADAHKNAEKSRNSERSKFAIYYEHNSTRFFSQFIVKWAKFCQNSIFLKMVWNFMSKGSLYYFVMFIFSILGILNPFFWCLMLFDIVRISERLHRLFRATSKQIINFASIFGYVIILTFIFASIYYKSVGIDHPEQIQSHSEYLTSLSTAFTTFIYYGVRTQGGVGEHFGDPNPESSAYYFRIVTDLAYFFLVNLFFMGCMIALVIESFFMFRKLKMEDQFGKMDFCWVCHKTRTQVQNAGQDWEFHFQQTHRIRSYFNLFVHLHSTGNWEETHAGRIVQDVVDKKDFTFMPLFNQK
jgi:hypothetical protein